MENMGGMLLCCYRLFFHGRYMNSHHTKIKNVCWGLDQNVPNVKYLDSDHFSVSLFVR